ncbi:MarC family protein [Oscillatoria amoena NRMC-F 0135]|jgi:multiple antibiotic resistance protein|nr:MAG: MarC family protein [Bacteroidota bacterium]MDL5046455.1 MarC family protein [Oscillatoria amoena NRMC-F 0135]
MFSFDEILTVSFTLFAVIDVIGSVPVIISLRSKIGHIQSEKVTLAAGALMILFLFIGKEFLGLMGVDLSSFAVAGSIVIFILGLEMILGIDIFKADPDPSSGSIVPVAFPIIAGSGTLTTVISLRADYGLYNILVGILLNLILIYVVLKSTNFIERKLGKGGLLVIRKFFGLILLAIAVKIFKGNLMA